MPQSLSKVYLHLTFRTKNSEALIDEAIESDLFEYLGGVCKGMECNPLRVGGTSDHVHILCTLSRSVTQADLLEVLKKKSSKWIKTKGEKYKHFYWQHGYGVFSVNPTETDVVAAYIENQKEHHRTKTYKEELLAFLRKYGVDYDERYLWD